MMRTLLCLLGGSGNFSHLGREISDIILIILLRKKCKDDSREATQGNKVNDKNPQGIKCHECLGFGHIQTECLNFQNPKVRP